MKRILSLPLLLSSAIVFIPALASADHVDFFLDGNFTSSSSLGDVGEVQGDSGNILGEFRKYETENASFSGSVSASLDSTLSTSLTLSDLGGGQGTYWFGYGNLSDSGADLNANFIGGAGWNALSFTIDSVNGSGMLAATVNSGVNSFTFSDLSVAAPGTYSFLQSEVTAITPAFDFTSVDGVSFQLTSDAPDSSFVISDFNRTVAVPEPSTSLFMILAACGFITRRRRTRR